MQNSPRPKERSPPATTGHPATPDNPFRIITGSASWSSQCTYSGRWTEEVRSSLTVLKGLTSAATGGLCAAATTSLPETLGGVRNWYYRYCWLRDATFTLMALLEAGHTSEAKAWRDWLLRAVAGDPADL